MNKEKIMTMENVHQGIDIKKILYLGVKRLFDIIISLIGILFLLPVSIIIKIVYLCSGDFKTIFYSHERIGKNGKTFKLYKYRTMVCNSKEMLEEMLKDEKYLKEWKENHKFENDPRVTKIGKLLRKTSLDELPQFINILIGDMSFVGPRPLIQEEVDDYGENKDKLLSMRPGLAGWWACNGRSCTSTEKRKELELYYIDHCSILFDIKVIFKTALAVLKKEGAK